MKKRKRDKPFTHVGEKVVDHWRRGHVSRVSVRLRETPTMWVEWVDEKTDGDSYRKPKETDSSRADRIKKYFQPRVVYLDVDTIREATPDDYCEFFGGRLELAQRRLSTAEQLLSEAQEKHAVCLDGMEKARQKLAEHCEAHGLKMSVRLSKEGNDE
jgi:hypothetical protein